MNLFTFVPDSTATTILGWTPGVKALVGGKVLVCGCLVGTYDTWRGGTVVILDERSTRCECRGHRSNAVLWASTAPAVPVLDAGASGTEIA